jgi:hypothetical protein
MWRAAVSRQRCNCSRSNLKGVGRLYHGADHDPSSKFRLGPALNMFWDRGGTGSQGFKFAGLGPGAGGPCGRPPPARGPAARH